MLILSRKVNEGFTSGILSISKGSRSTVMQLRSESRRARAFIVEPDHRVEAFPEGRLSAHFLAPQPAAQSAIRWYAASALLRLDWTREGLPGFGCRLEALNFLFVPASLPKGRPLLWVYGFLCGLSTLLFPRRSGLRRRHR